MKFLLRFLAVFTFVLFGLLQPLGAQAPQDQLSMIRMEDGNVLVGIILEQTTHTIHLETTTLGVVIIPTGDIEKITTFKPGTTVRRGELWEPLRLGARYFYIPNAYSLRKGEWYYQNINVFVNQISYGVNNNFTIGVGTIPFPEPLDVFPLFWVTPKVSIPITENKFQLGAGAILGGYFFQNEMRPFGIFYTTATFGAKDRNFSLGLGWGFEDKEWFDIPTAHLSGKIRVGKRTLLVSDLLVIIDLPFVVGILTTGGRTVWDTISLDYGLAIPITSDPFTPFIPYLGVGIPFGKARA